MVVIFTKYFSSFSLEASIFFGVDTTKDKLFRL